MPGSLQPPVSAGTFPISLSTKFAEAHSISLRGNEYHDGTPEISPVTTQTRRSWKLSKRLTVAQYNTLSAFWQANQKTVFGFYNPFETSPLFDPNPVGDDGFYLVRFVSDWSDSVGMVRSDLDVELIEVTASPIGSGAVDAGVTSTITSASVSVTASWVGGDSGIGIPGIDLVFGALRMGSVNFSSSGSLISSGITSTPTVFTLPFSTGDLTRLTSMSVVGYIEGTLFGSDVSQLATLKIYDITLAVHYQDGTVNTLRPRVASSQSGNAGGIFGGGWSGQVSDTPNALDADASTFALIERQNYNGFADAGYLQLAGWSL